MDVRDILRQYSMDSYAVQSIRATLRDIDEMHRSWMPTDFVRQAFEDQAAAAGFRIADFRAELRAVETGLERYSRSVNEDLGRLHTDSLRAVLGDFELNANTYFAGLAEQLSARHLLIGEVEHGSGTTNHSELLSRVGEGSRLLGEFSYEVSEDGAQAEVGEVEHVPQEVGSGLIEVKFFPIRVFELLRRNPELMKGLEDREFEEFCAELLAQMGFENVVLTPRSGDGGRDIIAVKSMHDIPMILAFECKRYKDSRKIGLAIMRSLLGSVAYRHTMANKGILLTTSSFTSGSRTFIAQEPRIDGKDFKDLVAWINSIGRSR